MAAKFLHTLADENPDLQIGSMTGIYQMFDRQLLVTSGSRHIVDRSSKRLLTSSNSYLNGGNLEGDNDDARLRSTSLEKNSYKTLQERQRLSIESSRASFTTSSRSSSFSSLDWNPAVQLEQVSSNKRVFADHRDSQQPLDLRDLVKDSMYREVESLSTKSKKAADIEMKQRMHADDERRDLLRSFSYHSKDESSSSISTDAPPRFSYDGREVNRTSYNSSRNVFRPSFPRYSLDSTECSSKSLNTDLKSNFLLKKSTGKDSNKSDEKFENVIKETQGRNQTRLPSVVARLMGLETLPDSDSLNKNNVRSSNNSSKDNDHVRITSPLAKTGSRNNLLKEPSSPRWKSPDGSIKPLVRFPLEPAPWKQSNKALVHQKSGSRRSTKDSMKDPRLSPSVYSEIDKRLKELEFLESGKDLRALKQIMEAIQGKEPLETQEEGEGSNFSSHKGQQGQKPGESSRKTDRAISSTTKKYSSFASYESPIVIMKPAKLVDKSASVIKIDGLPRPTKLKARDLNDYRKCSNSGKRDSVVGSVHVKNDKNTKTTLSSKRQQLLSKDGNNGTSGKILGSISPRMEQKKLDMEKRYRPPTSPSPVKSKPVQSNKKQEVSKSSSGRRRSKDPNFQRSDDQLSESSIVSSNSSYSEIDDSVQSSESSVHFSRSSEVSSSRRSPRTFMGASQSTVSGSVKKNSNLILRAEESTAHVYVPPAYSSPISVLDNVDEYKDSSPFPKKHVRNIPQDISRCKEEDSAIPQQGAESSSVSIGINRKKLENIDNLVQKLQKLNSSHDEANTDYIASLCDNTDPVHRYVSEILLASGLLLRDFGSNSIEIQFHHSGYPLNPELFLVLEQTKARTWLNQECLKGKKTRLTMNEKSHRKLIFDTVNEILARKLSSFACPANSDPCPRPIKLARMPLNAQKLLRDLCSEIEGLQNKHLKCNFTEEDEKWKTILSEDVMHWSESWKNFDIEISGIVLHIERLVFKDLVKEIVLGEINGSTSKSSRRKLFAQ